MPPVAYVTDFGQAVLLSVTTALGNFLSFLPGLIGAVILLIVGWVVANVLATLVHRALHAVGFERAVDRSGLGGFIARTGTTWTTSKLIAELIKWFVFLIFVQAAANVLGMPQITAVINSIVLFIPNVIVALAIVVVGSLVASLLSGLVRGSATEMGLSNAGLLAALTRYAIIGFAVVAAINQLGIAPLVVNALLIGLIGSIALAVGLAFGLGGRDVAAEITRTWYDGTRSVARRVQAETSDGGTGGIVYNPANQSGGRVNPEPGRTVPGPNQTPSI